MDQVCRICNASSESLLDIFDKRQLLQDKPSLGDMINDCASFKVNLKDTLPKKICGPCILDVESTYILEHNSEPIEEEQSEKEDILDTIVKDDQLFNEKENLLTSKNKSQVGADLESYIPNVQQSQSKNYKSKHYKCSHCSENLTGASNLKAHMLILHNDERPYKCSECPKAFAIKTTLIRHIRIHTGDRPYKCLFCPKTFSQSGNRIHHTRIHTGERPYKCSKCSEAFSRSSELKGHSRFHKEETLYKCLNCSKTFASQPKLTVHSRSHID